MIWTTEMETLLDEMVRPIPAFVRPLAKNKIRKKAEQVAREKRAFLLNTEHLIEGYRLAAPEKDKQRVEKFLRVKGYKNSLSATPASEPKVVISVKKPPQSIATPSRK